MIGISAVLIRQAKMARRTIQNPVMAHCLYKGRRRRIFPIDGCAFLSGLALSSRVSLTLSVADDYCVLNALLLH